MSLFATPVAGCDETRRTFSPPDVVELDVPVAAPGDGGGEASVVDAVLPNDDGPARDAGDGAAAHDATADAGTMDVSTADGALIGDGAPPDASPDAAVDAPLVDAPDTPDATVGARATPTLDGVIGADWPAATLVALNNEPSPWGPSLNALRSLRVAWDAERLYVGLEGVVEARNAIALYLDRDYIPGSAATGVSRVSSLIDTTGALDDALSAAIEAAPVGFGAELAWGTVGMQRKEPSELRADVGLRDIACARCAGDLGWIPGDRVVCGAAACEVSMTWTSIYGPAGAPPVPRLGLFVRLVNASGASVAPGQCLPPQTAPATTVTAVVALAPTP